MWFAQDPTLPTRNPEGGGQQTPKHTEFISNKHISQYLTLMRIKQIAWPL